MLQITVTDRRPVDPNVDELGRSWCGYHPDMTQEEMYRANHGCWVLGTQADSEHYVLFSHRGTIIQAVAIDRIEPVTGTRSNRKVIHGRILGDGDEVYDAYVGGDAPVQGVRNPVAYFDTRYGKVPCKCGCGAKVGRGWFVPGHDQKALHDRVAQIGNVAQFIDWFDRVRG